MAKKNKQNIRPGSSGKDEQDKQLADVVKTVKDRRFLGALFLYIAVCGVLLHPLLGRLVYKEGDIAESDIISPRNVDYEDVYAMEILKKQAMEKAPEVYRLEPEFLDTVKKIFDKVYAANANQDENKSADSIMQELVDYGIERESAEKLLSLEKDQPTQLWMQTDSIINSLTQHEFIDDTMLESLSDNIGDLAEKEGVDENLIPAVKDIVKTAVYRNMVKDEKESGKRAKEAQKSIQPMIRTIKKGEVIVRKGDPITESHIQTLNALNLMSVREPWLRIAGLAALIAFVFFIITAFLKNFSQDIYRNEKRIFIFYLLIFLTVASAVLIWSVEIFSPFLIGSPVAAFTILICVLLKPGLALVAMPAIMLAIALPLGMQMSHFLVAVVSGLGAYFYSIKPQDRDSLLKAGLSVSLGNIVAISVISLISFESLSRALLDIFLFGSLTGITASVVSMGSLPVFERLFNVTTPHRLLELSNPEEPLLKQMLIHAPGTYYHSFFVGNLAETVADSIGANSLLVRIACYYHDVGKLKRPYFFVENQMHGQNPMNELNPTLGALVISSHVKDGVEMAREHNLPEEVVSIIAEHHGNLLISYFHKQAQAAAPEGQEVSEERFRYPGPRPASAESAIVMLSDACEAAVRAIPHPTPKLIENTVNKIIEERVFDGQFDQCNITLRQIDTMRLTLLKTLANIYHSRMEYPDLDDLKKQRDAARDPEKKNGNGRNNKQNPNGN